MRKLSIVSYSFFQCWRNLGSTPHEFQDMKCELSTVDDALENSQNEMSLWSAISILCCCAMHIFNSTFQFHKTCDMILLKPCYADPFNVPNQWGRAVQDAIQLSINNSIPRVFFATFWESRWNGDLGWAMSVCFVQKMQFCHCTHTFPLYWRSSINNGVYAILIYKHFLTSLFLSFRFTQESSLTNLFRKTERYRPVGLGYEPTHDARATHQGEKIH